jgi:hypothetical protein
MFAIQQKIHPETFAFQRQPFCAALLSLFLLILGSTNLFASGERNLLPRMPEFIIERGYSDAFQVLECEGTSSIVNETAESRLRAKLRNISPEALATSIKVRILYLISDESAVVTVNGKRVPFSRKNPRIPLNLAPNEEIELMVTARHHIHYNLDAIKAESEKDKDKDKARFGLGDFARFFGKENFGRRYLIGTLVSKWGIFPVDFQKVEIRVVVPRDFVGIVPPNHHWEKKDSGNTRTYIFSGTQGFNGTMFVPQQDLEPVISNLQKVASATPF